VRFTVTVMGIGSLGIHMRDNDDWFLTVPARAASSFSVDATVRIEVYPKPASGEWRENMFPEHRRTAHEDIIADATET
jgi:hypothetical protein